MDDDQGASWFGVRCFFEWRGPGRKRDRVYEERITLWRGKDFDEAIAKAEAEALEYLDADRAAGPGPVRQLSLIQAYRMDEGVQLAEGAEVFSLLRESNRKPRAYLERHFDTGREND